MGEFQLQHGQTNVTHFYSDKVRALLVYLAVAGGTPTKREHLIEMFWPRYLRSSGLTNLRRALHELRRTLPDVDALRGSRQSIWLERGSGEILCDWWEIEDILRDVEGHGHASLGTCHVCGAKLERLQAISPGLLVQGLNIDEPEGFDSWRASMAQATEARIRALLSVQRLRLTSGVGGNIPLVQPALFGRAREMDQLTQLIEEAPHRLISLTGMGGIGKTSLALALARRVVGLFPDGIWRCAMGEARELSRSDASGGSLLLVTLARTLGLGGELNAGEILARLREHRLLILFDELEQVMGSEAELLDRIRELSALTHGLPGACVLITSRLALRMEGELFYPLKGLTLPPPGEEEPGRSPAVTLFLSVRGARLDLPAPTPQELTQITEIARCMEGHPLGLKLAAAESQRVSIAQVLHRVRAHPSGLESPFRDSPPRHRQLSALISESVESLEASARLLLIGLSLWEGPILPEDVCVVFEGLPEAAEIPQMLRVLARRCLIEPLEGGGYHQHTLLREIVRSEAEVWIQGQAEGETRFQGLSRAWRRHFRDRLRAAWPTVLRGDLPSRAPLLRALPDLLRAWTLSVEAGELLPLVEGAGALFFLGQESGLGEACILRLRALGRSLEAQGGDTPTPELREARARLTLYEGVGLHTLGRTEACVEALQGAEAAVLRPGEAALRDALLGTAQLLGGGVTGEALGSLESQRARPAIEDLEGCLARIMVESGLGTWRARHGEEAAEARILEALRLSEAGGFVRSQVRNLMNLAGWRNLQGRSEAALAVLERARGVVYGHALQEMRAPLLMGLGFVYTELREFDRGMNAYEEASQEAHRLALPSLLAQVHLSIGASLCMQSEFRRSAVCLERVRVMDGTLGAPLLLARAEVMLGACLVALGDARCLGHLREGRRLAESLAYWPTQCQGDAGLLGWGLREGDEALIREGVGRLLGWMDAHPALPSTNIYQNYLLCFRGLEWMGGAEAARVLREGVAHLYRCLSLLSSVARRETYLRGYPEARALLAAHLARIGRLPPQWDALLGGASFPGAAPPVGKRATEDRGADRQIL